MALSRDSACALNQLRSQYLSLVDDDQAHRIMRPYANGIQLEPRFGVLLARMDSPPIPIDVGEDSTLAQTLVAHETLTEESEDDSEPHAMQRPNGFMDSLKGSLATLKLGDHQDVVRRTSSTFASRNVLSKLFRNTSSSSTLQSRRSVSTLEHTDDDDDDDDDVYDDDDDDEDGDDDDDDDDDDEAGDTSALAENEFPIDDSRIELNEDADTVTSEGGIFVEQNYSDVNPTQMGHFHDEILHNTVSSGDDDLALDSDFSNEDNQIADATFQSSGGARSILYPKSAAKSAYFTPSRIPNRRLSFDKTIRPRTKKRSESLVQKRSTGSAGLSLAQESHSLRHSTSVSTLDSSYTLSETFTKVEILGKPVQKSMLTSLVGKKDVSNKDPLGLFEFVNGDKISDRNDVLDLKIWLPDRESFNLKVRQSVRVFDVIGFALLTLSHSSSSFLTHSSLLRDPNKWCCKLVEEDGEPYEGAFGLMDRTKSIGSYGEDEVALCEVNEVDFQINQKRTPLPTTEEDRATSPTKNQNSYYKSILPHIDNDIKDAKTVKVQVFEYPYHPDSAKFINFELLITDKLNDILVRYTSAKTLPVSDYVLKAVGESYVLDLKDTLSSLDENYTLEALTKRTARELRLQKKKILDTSTLPTINSNLTPQTLVMKQILPDESNRPGGDVVPEGSSTRKNSLSKHTAFGSFRNKNMFRLQKDQDRSILHTDINSEYHKFTVWRRLPMSFINRHERTLAIDGEYVYIMPKDEKLWYDTNFKTTTFHVSQISSCKVSKRIPTNFKIIVIKSSGPKRYVFEALNKTEARQIIDKLQTLMEAYTMNMSASMM